MLPPQNRLLKTEVGDSLRPPSYPGESVHVRSASRGSACVPHLLHGGNEALEEREGGHVQVTLGWEVRGSVRPQRAWGGMPLTQRMRDEVQEGISQEAPRGKAEQHLQQGLVLGGVGLHRDQEEDEVGGCADEEGGPNGLRTRAGQE